MSKETTPLEPHVAQARFDVAVGYERLWVACAIAGLAAAIAALAGTVSPIAASLFILATVACEQFIRWRGDRDYLTSFLVREITMRTGDQQNVSPEMGAGEIEQRVEELSYSRTIAALKQSRALSVAYGVVTSVAMALLVIHVLQAGHSGWTTLEVVAFSVAAGSLAGTNLGNLAKAADTGRSLRRVVAVASKDLGR